MVKWDTLKEEIITKEKEWTDFTFMSDGEFIEGVCHAYNWIHKTIEKMESNNMSWDILKERIGDRYNDTFHINKKTYGYFNRGLLYVFKLTFNRMKELEKDKEGK